MSQSEPSTRKRAFQACVNCRIRKAKCITPEDSCIGPCARCTKKNLVCEFSVEPGPAEHPAQQAPYAPYQATQSYQPYTAPQAPYAYAAPAYPPPLPYTAPPPMYSRARYAGGAYPDLSLAPANSTTSSQAQAQAQQNMTMGSRQVPAQGSYPQQTSQYPYTGQYSASAPGGQYPR